jgi:hypothetical protein
MPRNLLERLFEYRRLLTRDSLEDSLDAVSRVRLDILGQLFAPGADDSRREHERHPVALRGILKKRGRALPVQVVNISGGGMCIRPAVKLEPGERAVVRIVSGFDGVEYHYPVRAEWAVRDSFPPQMGMPFIGAPMKGPEPEVLDHLRDRLRSRA